jgi:ABC-type branched-subunit amino acid transport system substrate-binding protein
MVLLILLGSLTACEEVPPEPEGVCPNDPLGCLEIEGGDPLVIGALLDLSGPQNDIGRDSLNGILLAADYIDGRFDGESATFLGHAIEIRRGDGRCRYDGRSHDLIRDLADDERIAGVIGPTCWELALGVADTILGDNGIPLISPSATWPDLTGLDHHPFFFRTAHNAVLELEELARFAYSNLGAATAATVASENSRRRTAPFENAFTDLTGSIVHRAEIPEGQTDFADIVDEIARSANGRPPDTVLLPPYGARYAMPFARAARSGTLRNVDLLAAESINGLCRNIAPPVVCVTGPSFEFSGDFYENEFLPAYRARFGEPGAGYHAFAFDATMMLLTSIEEVAIVDTQGPTTILPRTALRDAIAVYEREGLSGLIACDEDGDCNPEEPLTVLYAQP